MMFFVVARSSGWTRCEITFEGRLEFAGMQSEDRAKLIGAIHPAGADVPLVAADLGDALRFGELGLAGG